MVTRVSDVGGYFSSNNMRSGVEEQTSTPPLPRIYGSAEMTILYIGRSRTRYIIGGCVYDDDGENIPNSGGVTNLGFALNSNNNIPIDRKKGKERRTGWHSSPSS